VLIDNFIDKLDDKKIMLFLGIFIISVFILDGFMDFPILTDMGIINYIAQSIVDGHTIYSAAPEIKGPLTMILDSVFIIAFSFVPNWLAIRIGMLGISLVSILFFYKFSSKFFSSKLLGIYSVLILLSFDMFIEFSSIGEPKIVAMFLTIFVLYFSINKKYFYSGLFSGLCFLAWQPSVLIFLSPIVSIFLNEKSDINKFDFNKLFKKLFNAGIGLSIPILSIILYFVVFSTFDDFLYYMIQFPIEYKSLAIERVDVSNFYTLFAYFGTEILFFGLAFLGLLHYGWKSIVSVVKSGFRYSFRYIEDNKKYVIFFSPYLLLLMYTLFDLVNGDDLFIIFPAIIFLSVISLRGIINYVSRRFKFSLNKMKIIVLLFILFYGFFTVFQPLYPQNPIMDYEANFVEGSNLGLLDTIIQKYGFVESVFMYMTIRMGEEGTIEHQLNVSNYIQENTDEGEKILSLSAPEILFLSGRENINKYIVIESTFLLNYFNQTGRLGEFSDEVKITKPKFIVLEESSYYRNPNIIEILELEEFLSDNYIELEFVKYTLYELK
jgi:hypothetical protein